VLRAFQPCPLSGKPEGAGRPAGSRWCKSITMKK
jgi:hypothetical protein